MSLIKYRSGDDETKDPASKNYWNWIMISCKIQRQTLMKIRNHPEADKLGYLIFSRMNVKEFLECEKVLGVDEEKPPFDDILSAESCDLLLQKYAKEYNDEPVLISNTLCQSKCECVVEWLDFYRSRFEKAPNLSGMIKIFRYIDSELYIKTICCKKNSYLVVQCGFSTHWKFNASIEKCEKDAPKWWKDYFKVKSCLGPKAKRTTWIGTYRIIPKSESPVYNLQQINTIYDWPEYESTNQKIKDVTHETILSVIVFSSPAWPGAPVTTKEVMLEFETLNEITLEELKKRLEKKKPQFSRSKRKKENHRSIQDLEDAFPRIEEFDTSSSEEDMVSIKFVEEDK